MTICYVCKKTKAKYNKRGHRAKYCSKCKVLGMLDLSRQYCTIVGCDVRASFRVPGEKVKYCAKHKKENMENVCNDRKCIHIGCDVRASFNVPGEKAKYCAKHKKENMENVIKHAKCTHNGCERRASFNVPGEKAKYCAKHKEENMENVNNHATCIHIGCERCASFNVSGEKAKYCAKHKKENMINVNDYAKCIHIGCKTRPSYGIPGKKPLSCAQHKTCDLEDVVSKKCLHPQCKIQPLFAVFGEVAQFCFEHKLSNMQNVRSKKCLHPTCNRRSTYAAPNEVTAYCIEHKLDFMENVRSKRCVQCNITYLSTKNRYDGHCLRCFIHVFPDKPVFRNHKTKERATVHFVIDNFPKVTWTEDKRVAGGCSSRRPDLLLDLGYQVIIIEVDENQHHFYDPICENRRMMEIFQDVQRPIVFLRFNPDKYDSVKSCWVQNKNGIDVICKKRKGEWDARLETLRQTIEFHVREENQTQKEIEVVRLFYDKQ